MSDTRLLLPFSRLTLWFGKVYLKSGRRSPKQTVYELTSLSHLYGPLSNAVAHLALTVGLSSALTVKLRSRMVEQIVTWTLLQILTMS